MPSAVLLGDSIFDNSAYTRGEPGRRLASADRARDVYLDHHCLVHLKHVYEKLQVHAKSEAVAKALRERLI